jgi:hypothetical protein
MKTNRHLGYAAAIIACSFFFSCHNPSQKDTDIKEPVEKIVVSSTINNLLNPSSNFLDSISHRYDLTLDQIKIYTKIDSDYFIPPNCKFTGDSIISTKSGYIVAIINYDDAMVCRDKFLLVFDAKTGMNTDWKLIETDCDEDEGASISTKRSYKLISDDRFSTTETITNKNKVEKTRIIWIINYSGKIAAIAMNDSAKE